MKTVSNTKLTNNNDRSALVVEDALPYSLQPCGLLPIFAKEALTHAVGAWGWRCLLPNNITIP